METIAEELRCNKERLHESQLLLSIVDLYTRGNHKSGQHLEEQSSTESISDAFENYLSNMIAALHIVCLMVYKLVSKWTLELETVEGEAKVVRTDMLSTLVDILHVLTQFILIKFRYIS